MARQRYIPWRSARWMTAPAGAVSGGGVAALPPSTSAEGAPALLPGQVDERILVTRWPWQGVQWSLGFVGFLSYVAVITTYIAPIGTETALLMLIGTLVGEKPRLTPFMLILLAVYAIGVLGYLGSPWKVYTGEDFQNMGKMMVVAFCAQALLVTRERIRFFIFFYLAVFALYPIRGALFNYFIYNSTEQGRVAWNNLFSNPNDIAALVLFPFALSLGLLHVERNRYLRYAAMVGLVLIPLVLALSQSRGAILAFMAGGALIFLRTKKARMMMMLGAGVIGLVLAIFAPEQLWSRLGSLENSVTSGDLSQADDLGSAEQRFEIWKVAVTVIAQNPAIGVGPGSYPFAHVFAARDPNIDNIAGGLRDAHSTYLTVAAEYGVPGFFLFMTAAFMVWFASRRARRIMDPVLPRHSQQLLYAEIGLVAFATAAVFGSYVTFPFTYITLALIMCMAEVGMQDAKKLPAALRPVARAA